MFGRRQSLPHFGDALNHVGYQLANVLAVTGLAIFFFLSENVGFQGVCFKYEVKMGRDKEQGENAKGKGPVFFALPYSHKGYIYFALLRLSSQHLPSAHFLGIH